MRGQPVPFCPSALEKVLDDPTLQLKLQSCPERFAGLRSDTKKHRQNKSIQIYQKHTRARVSTRPQCGLCQHEAGNFWMCHIREASKLSICRLILRLGLSIPPYYIIYHHLSSIHVRFCSRLSVNGLGAADPRAFISLGSRDAALIAGPLNVTKYTMLKTMMVQLLNSHEVTNGDKWPAMISKAYWLIMKSVKESQNPWLRLCPRLQERGT